MIAIFAKSPAQNKNIDKTDFWSDYLINKRPRDFFKGINQIIYYPSHLLSLTKNSLISRTLSAFSGAYNAFNLLDFFENVNDLRNSFYRKDVKKGVKSLDEACVDVVGSFADSMYWISATKIFALTALASNIFSGINGSTLLYSCSKHFVRDVKALHTDKDIKSDENKKNIQLWKIAKDIAYLALGALMMAGAYLTTSVFVPYMVYTSSITVIANANIYYLQNQGDITS